MRSYAISFRIHDDATRATRYASLVEQINDDPLAWDETTSFAIVTSDETLSTIANRLYFSSELLDTKDILLVIDLAANTAIARGPLLMEGILRRQFHAFEKR